MLCGLELPVVDDPLVLRRGVELRPTKQHLFDTYYHAVALETQDTVLITRSEPTFGSARKGRIIHLSRMAQR